MRRFLLASACFAWAAAATAQAAPIALVIGNAAYTGLPPLPACSASAGLVARKLASAGYDVSSANDLSNGGMDGAISTFTARAAASPSTAALIYICAYGAGLDERDFILPVSAQIAGPSDLLAEGVLARSVLGGAHGSRQAPLLIALDLVRDPAGKLAPPSGTLARAALPGGVGAAVVVETRPPEAPTELAGALAAAASAGPLGPDTLGRIAAHIHGGNVSTVAGVQDARLDAAPPQAGDQAPTPAAEPATPLPADDQLTEAQRRRVQIALAGLGYYDGRLDGVFGEETRAAIRRWQHEVGAPMTGQLTGPQATKLVAAQK
jgi:hypothetical protein